MATQKVSGEKSRGRPVFVASIPWAKADSQAIGIIERFYNVMATLNYRQKIGLARAFSVHLVTVERWRYRMTLPNLTTVCGVLEWAAMNCPLYQRYQGSHPHPSELPYNDRRSPPRSVTDLLDTRDEKRRRKYRARRVVTGDTG